MNSEEDLSQEQQDELVAQVLQWRPERVSRQIRALAVEMPQSEVRRLVDVRYQILRGRVQTQNRLSAGQRGTDNPPMDVLAYFLKRQEELERHIAAFLLPWAESHQIGRWLLSIPGIGPTFTCGLIAHIDIEKATTVSKLWRFAGLDPTIPAGKKGVKRVYNARLKTLLWQIGSSFLRCRNEVYCSIYYAAKAKLEEQNERGEFAKAAAEKLETVNIGVARIKGIYESGKLPPKHIHARALRVMEKLFLSHLWEVWQQIEHPERPLATAWVFGPGGHTSQPIPPPNWPME